LSLLQNPVGFAQALAVSRQRTAVRRLRSMRFSEVEIEKLEFSNFLLLQKIYN
jgi:hypothetical protein